MRNEYCQVIQPAEAQEVGRSVLGSRAEKGRVMAARGRPGPYTLVKGFKWGMTGSRWCFRKLGVPAVPMALCAHGREAGVMLLICQVILTAPGKT